MTRLAFFIACMGWAVVGQAGELETMERLYGRGDLVTATGNGSLTVGANAKGQVNLCRWPGAGGPDQLSYKSGSGGVSGQGLQWGLRLGEEVLWLTNPDWTVTQDYAHVATTVMRTTARLHDSPVSIEQTIFVHPEEDLLVTRLEVRGLDTAVPFYWFADFTPCTRQLPEIPLADWALDAANDFAVFAVAESQTIYHFRPAHPGATDWERAERLAQAPPIAAQWKSFEDGVWMAYSSLEEVDAWHCGAEGETPSEAVRDHLDSGSGRAAATGACYSVVRITPRKEGDLFVATVLTGFGADSDEAEKALERGRRDDYATLLKTTVDHWYAWLLDAAVPSGTDFDTVKLMMRCLLTLATVTDDRRGAMVRGPSTQPPLARDWARHGTWMTYALDLAGYRQTAERHVLSYRATVRKVGRRGKPRGSLPGSVYANGEEASPHWMLDTEGTAWLLWSFSQHSSFLDYAEREVFLRKVWDTTVLSADFLAGWADGRRGAPLHSYDPARLRDLRTTDLLVATHLGLESAILIAEFLGERPPVEWTRRKTELDVLLRVLCLDEGLSWGLEEALPFSLGEILPEEDPRLAGSVAARLDALPELTGYAAAKALCEVVMLWRRNPSKLASLKPYVKPVLERALTTAAAEGGQRLPARPDALTASLCYVSALSILGAER